MLAVVLGLNLIPLLQGAYHVVHLLCTGIMLVCILPMFVYLLNPVERLPWVQMICLIYALQYAFFPFLGMEQWYSFAHLTIDDLVYTQVLTLLGVTILVVGYYTQPIKLFLAPVRPPRMDWHPRQVRFLALVFIMTGLFALGLLKTGRTFPGGEQLIFFLSKMSIIGILALFLLQLRGQIGLSFKLFLWGALAPGYILLAISAGNAAPLALFVISVSILYIGERRRIPWAAVALGIIVLLPFMWAKHEYRDSVWTSPEHGGAEFQNVGEALSNVMVFADIAGQSVFELSGDEAREALRTVLTRFDITYLFAHVARMTPSQVPYLKGESYNDILWKFVPRLLFPDKPNPTYGQIFGHMYQILSIGDMTTAINFPQMVEMYVNFGAAGVLIGMFLMAQIYRLLDHFLNVRGRGDWLAVFGASIFSGLFAIESNFSLVVAGVIYHIVLLYMIGFFIRIRPVRGR